jgi:hypothetical protein
MAPAPPAHRRVNVARDISTARALFEKAERETRPELKAHALEEAVTLLASIDPDEVSDAEGKLIANLRMAHTRRLLAQLVGLTSVSMDDWFDYIGLLLGELSPEVERVSQADPQLKENYERFLGLWGEEIAGILKKQRQGAP